MSKFYEFGTKEVITVSRDIKAAIARLKKEWRQIAATHGHRLSNFTMAEVYKPNWNGPWKDSKLGFDPTYVAAHCKACHRELMIIADFESPVRHFSIDQRCPGLRIRYQTCNEDPIYLWHMAIVTEIRAHRGVKWDNRLGREVRLAETDFVGVAVYEVGSET